MKNLKKTISLLLAVIIMATTFTALPFTASAAENLEMSEVGASSGTTGDCTWTLDDNGTLTISGNGAMEDYYLYSDINGNLVSTVPWGTNVKNVVIEKGVTSIGDSAFSDCTGLTSVTIGNGVTSIGWAAFEYCAGLTSVTIPNSVTSIGGSAFSDCTGLTSITIPDGVTSIGEGAFSGCTGLTSVTIGNSVTSIGGSAFYRCTGLTSVTIPDSVTSIGRRAIGYYFDTNTWKYEKVDGFTIYGVKGSEAERYANDNGFIFKEIGSEISKKTGDVNGDNTVDVLDAAAIQKHASGISELNSEQLAAADVNGDGNVDVLDAADIQKFAAGIISEFKKKA